VGRRAHLVAVHSAILERSSLSGIPRKSAGGLSRKPSSRSVLVFISWFNEDFLISLTTIQAFFAALVDAAIWVPAISYLASAKTVIGGRRMIPLWLLSCCGRLSLCVVCLIGPILRGGKLPISVYSEPPRFDSSYLGMPGPQYGEIFRINSCSSVPTRYDSVPLNCHPSPHGIVNRSDMTVSSRSVLSSHLPAVGLHRFLPTVGEVRTGRRGRRLAFTRMSCHLPLAFGIFCKLCSFPPVCSSITFNRPPPAGDLFASQSSP